MLKMIKPSERIYKITVEFDSEANVFIAFSDDIPGLATEATTFQGVVERVCAIAPELLALNNGHNAAPEYLAFEQEAVYVPYSKGEMACA